MLLAVLTILTILLGFWAAAEFWITLDQDRHQEREIAPMPE
jgi:hypothetical protein